MLLLWMESEFQCVPDTFPLTVVFKDSRLVGTRTDPPIPSEHHSVVIGGNPSDLDQQLA